MNFFVIIVLLISVFIFRYEIHWFFLFNSPFSKSFEYNNNSSISACLDDSNRIYLDAKESKEIITLLNSLKVVERKMDYATLESFWDEQKKLFSLNVSNKSEDNIVSEDFIELSFYDKYIVACYNPRYWEHDVYYIRDLQYPFYDERNEITKFLKNLT